jgi:hypothetical protein
VSGFNTVNIILAVCQAIGADACIQFGSDCDDTASGLLCAAGCRMTEDTTTSPETGSPTIRAPSTTGSQIGAPNAPDAASILRVSAWTASARAASRRSGLQRQHAMPARRRQGVNNRSLGDWGTACGDWTIIFWRATTFRTAAARMKLHPGIVCG